MELNHKKLVEYAIQWLSSAKQCNPVFAEKGSAKSGEMPDAIGWSAGGSVIVECKTSIEDFRADAKKPFRIEPEKGMGKFRYYLFSTELYRQLINEIPEGWGVAIIDGFCRVEQARFKSSKEWAFDVNAELYYMRNRILEIQRFGR